MTRAALPGAVLGLDPGEARIGVAISDAERRVAVPLGAIDVRRGGVIAAVADLVREHAVTRVVVGEPRSMDGSRGTRAEAALDFAEALRNALDVPVDLQDERLSTVEGTKRLREAGVPSRRSKRVVDAAAAQVILQAWLDAR